MIFGRRHVSGVSNYMFLGSRYPKFVLFSKITFNFKHLNFNEHKIFIHFNMYNAIFIYIYIIE